MARFKPQGRNSLLLPVVLSEQILPGKHYGSFSKNSQTKAVDVRLNSTLNAIFFIATNDHPTLTLSHFL